jgi:hypothetical protein
MGQSASFPFEIGAEPDRGYPNRHRGAYWQLYSGRRKVRPCPRQSAPAITLSPL